MWNILFIVNAYLDRPVNKVGSRCKLFVIIAAPHGPRRHSSSTMRLLNDSGRIVGAHNGRITAIGSPMLP